MTVTRAIPWLVLCALSLLPGTHIAAQDGPPATPDPLAVATAAIIADHDKALADFWEQLGRIPDEDGRQAFAKRKFPQVDAYVDRVWKLLGRRLDTPGALPGLAWILEKGEDRRDRAKARDALLAHHLGEAGLVAACHGLQWTKFCEEDLAFLRTVAADSPLRDVRGNALNVLGTRLAGSSRSGDKDAPARAREAEEAFVAVRKDYADVAWGGSTLGALAEGPLFELRNLAIGMVAPDIEGTDVRGKAFRLSDFRGQVVILDFFGFW